MIFTQHSIEKVNIISSTGVASEAKQAFEANPEAVLIINAKLSDRSGLSVAKPLLERNKSARIILWTTTAISEYYASELKSMGIKGYMHNGMLTNIYIEAAKTVWENKTYFPAEVAG
jgi:DNA-binding NarL/FixJ family response regulator